MKYLIILFISINLFANNCLDKSFNGNSFYNDKSITNVWDNNKKIFIKEYTKDTTIYPNCKISNNLEFFMYLYRDDLPEILLIQYIFKGSQYEFYDFYLNILNNDKFTKSINNINSNKLIQLEIKNASTKDEYHIQIKNKEIISNKKAFSYKK